MNTFSFSPGLLQLRDWAREKQDDSEVPMGERVVWRQIADEVDAFHSLSEPPPDEPADTLFGGPR